LLEQGKALAVVERVREMTPVLDRVRDQMPVEDMPPEVRERYEWQRGWVALYLGERRDAKAHFTRAVDAARISGDIASQVRALYGRSQSETWVNRVAPDRDRAAALRDHREAAQLLERSQLDRLQRFDQRLQLLSNLFWLGEYLEGWPLVRQQMAEADQLYGENPPVSSALPFFYTAYLWRLGRPQEALAWLAARERHQRASGTAPPGPPLSRELAMQARLLLAVDRPAEARAIIDGWHRTNLDPPVVDQLRIGVPELEWAQVHSTPDEVLRLLASKPWSGLAADDDSEWPLYPLWHRGIALERKGDVATAVPILEAAVGKARDVFGEGHPRVALVRLSLAFVRWRGGGAQDIAGRADLATALAGIVSDLEQGMPPEHPALKDARVFLSHIRGASATESDIRRWRDPTATFHP
jgi:tetratricopeptide (TPR) repeat protein